MNNLSAIDSTPWYRQLWPWLLIIPPGGAVIGGIFTIILAVQSPNALVVDNYYREGLAINQQLHRLNAARAQQLSAFLRYDGHHLQLTVNGSKQPDTTLALQFIHVTRADLDRTIQLKKYADGEYSAPVPALPAGIWYLRLHPGDKRWEIRTRVQTGEKFQARLSAD
ncbi:Putative analog of CcoH, COG3198 [hydrothermal vent metagenome]|uniref:Analog of CcoH, COG3198 n=1 Tax=hydrothermal vent metagenome TaxID=652676 RepID=A0A3B0YKJ1_9ZZZZ